MTKENKNKTISTTLICSKKIFNLALFLLLCCGITVTSCRKNHYSGENKPMTEKNKDSNQLEGIVITYEILSTKVGAGKQEIHIRGDLTAKLYYTKNCEAAPKTAEASIPKEALLRLLEMFESENFELMEKEIEESPMAGLRRLKLTRSGKVYTVGRRGAIDAKFERLVGAVKLVAGLAHPSVTQQTFFPNL